MQPREAALQVLPRPPAPEGPAVDQRTEPPGPQERPHDADTRPPPAPHRFTHGGCRFYLISSKIEVISIKCTKIVITTFR